MAYSLVHYILGFSKVSARWMPKHLTEQHKRNHQNICSSLLQQYNHEGDNFLSHTIIWDETWNHHYGSENKWQSMQWKHMSSPLQQRVVTWTVATLCCKVLVDNVLGLQRANPQTLYGERYHSNKCKLLWHAKKWSDAGCSHKTDRKVVTGHCLITQKMQALLWHTSPSTPFRKFIGKFSSNLSIAQTWLLLIYICLDPSGTF